MYYGDGLKKIYCFKKLSIVTELSILRSNLLHSVAANQVMLECAKLQALRAFVPDMPMCFMCSRACVPLCLSFLRASIFYVHSFLYVFTCFHFLNEQGVKDRDKF